MLVVTRKRNETIIISDSIRVTLLEINGRNVRLGIEAPKEVPIHREEVYQRLISGADRQTAA